MAYKKLIKVSNVCQVLDKRKFPATTTINGVTFTNNGDGRWTISGKSTSNYSYYNLVNNFPLKQGHTYLAPYTVIGTCYVEVKFMNKDYAVQWGKVIYTADENSKVVVGLIALNTFYGADTVLIPQLFDLTEMYGAGHEPTTVEEFRQKFPEAMYDYSPHCWLTSYKRVILTGEGNYLTSYQRNLTCKTKNLFDISKVVQSNNIKSDNRDIACSSYGSSIGVLKDLCPSLKVGDVVTLSLRVKSTTSVAPNFVQIQGKILYFSNPITFTVTEAGLNSNFYLYNTSFENRDVPTTSVFTDIMIELGDTATEYVPYGHL